MKEKVNPLFHTDPFGHLAHLNKDLRDQRRHSSITGASKDKKDTAALPPEDLPTPRQQQRLEGLMSGG